MKILHIHSSMQGGGIESMICGLANEMSKEQNVSVCSIFEPTEKDVFWNKLLPAVHKFTLGKNSIGFSLSYLFKIYKFIKKGHYDVVHIHGTFYYYFLSVLMLHKSIHFVYTFHSDAYMENNAWDLKIMPLKKCALRSNWVHPVTISPASQESFKKLYALESSLVENGIPKPIVHDETEFVRSMKPHLQTKVFFHPGRITKAKNQEVLCKVFKRLVEDGEDVMLLIAGSMQDADIYSKIETFFNERIVYLGERNDVTDLFAAVDGFCLPSIWEGLPVTLLEALAVGCIPICSPVGGIVNVIEDGENGFLSKSSSEDDYYNTMKRVLHSTPDVLIDIKSHARESFKRFDISLTTEKYLQLYDSLVPQVGRVLEK